MANFMPRKFSNCERNLGLMPNSYHLSMPRRRSSRVLDVAQHTRRAGMLLKRVRLLHEGKVFLMFVMFRLKYQHCSIYYSA